MKPPIRVLPWVTPVLENPTTYNGQAMGTFSYDDGRNNVYDYAVPLHERYNIPATFHIIGSEIRSEPHWHYMEAARLKDLVRRGFEVSSHSYWHGRFPNMTDAELHWDLHHANEVIEKTVGERVTTMAVPNSAYDQRTRNIARQYYDGVRVYENLFNTIPPQDRYWLHSAVAVKQNHTASQLKAVIDNAVSDNAWCIMMMHGVRPGAPTYYDTTPEILEDIFQHINALGREVILPVNMRDGLRLSGALG